MCSLENFVKNQIDVNSRKSILNVLLIFFFYSNKLGVYCITISKKKKKTKQSITYKNRVYHVITIQIIQNHRKKK